MKLYATVSSERATKGQGGKELHIIVRNEKQNPCIALKVNVDATGRVQGEMFVDIIHATVKSQGTFIEDKQTKGKQQKGEVCEYHGVENCPRCDPHHK